MLLAVLGIVEGVTEYLFGPWSIIAAWAAGGIPLLIRAERISRHMTTKMAVSLPICLVIFIRIT